MDQTHKPKIIGSYLSPYVRKILATLHCKGIAYEIDPIIPFFGDDRFAQMSPLRGIPVFIDADVTLCDSSVIAQYIDERYPDPPLQPKSAQLRARARWLEEFADTRMGDVFIWRLFNQVAINPFVWGIKTDPEILAKTLSEDVPSVLNYLEREVPREGFFFGTLSLADISIASFFRNAKFARYEIDETPWPLTASFVNRVLDQECFAVLKPFEEKLLRTKIPDHRKALAELGAPLTQDSLGTPTPRKGIMRQDLS